MALEEFGIGNKRQLYEVMKNLNIVERTETLDLKYGDGKLPIKLAQSNGSYLDHLLLRKSKQEAEYRKIRSLECSIWSNAINPRCTSSTGGNEAAFASGVILPDILFRRERTVDPLRESRDGLAPIAPLQSAISWSPQTIEISVTGERTTTVRRESVSGITSGARRLSNMMRRESVLGQTSSERCGSILRRSSVTIPDGRRRSSNAVNPFNPVDQALRKALEGGLKLAVVVPHARRPSIVLGRNPSILICSEDEEYEVSSKTPDCTPRLNGILTEAGEIGDMDSMRGLSLESLQ
jgi:hypothetical protein